MPPLVPVEAATFGPGWWHQPGLKGALVTVGATNRDQCPSLVPVGFTNRDQCSCYIYNTCQKFHLVPHSPRRRRRPLPRRPAPRHRRPRPSSPPPPSPAPRAAPSPPSSSPLPRRRQALPQRRPPPVDRPGRRRPPAPAPSPPPPSPSQATPLPRPAVVVVDALVAAAVALAGRPRCEPPRRRGSVFSAFFFIYTCVFFCSLHFFHIYN